MNTSSLGLTVGSLLVASWLAAALTGVIFFQAYLFFRGKPEDDSRIFGFIVLSLCVLDAAHIACVMISLYQYLIRDFGDEQALNDFEPALAVSMGITAFITLIVQSFFCWRLWKLSRVFKFVVPAVVALLVMRLACGLVAIVEIIKVGGFTAYIADVRWVFTAGTALGVICDIVVTYGLCSWLYGTRNVAYTMNNTIDKLILYTIENGALTSMTSIASLTCILTMPKNLVFIAVHTIIGKFFINSFLASLNARNKFRAEKERDKNAVDISSTPRFARPPSGNHANGISDSHVSEIPDVFPAHKGPMRMLESYELNLISISQIHNQEAFGRDRSHMMFPCP